MRGAATITHWLTAILMAVAFTLAPIAPAVAACAQAMGGQSPMHGDAAPMQMGTDHATQTSAPCDQPCNDCTPAMKKQCAGQCVCTPMIIAFPTGSLVIRIAAERMGPDRFLAPTPLARSPDTPPPKSLA